MMGTVSVNLKIFGVSVLSRGVGGGIEGGEEGIEGGEGC